MHSLKSIRLFFILLLALLLCACATNGDTQKYPSRGSDQAAYHVEKAKSALSKSEGWEFGSEVDIALTKPTGDVLISNYFTSTPQASPTYKSYLRGNLKRISNLKEANLLLESINAAYKSNVLDPSAYTELTSSLRNKVIIGHLDGSIVVELDDSIANFQELATKEHQTAIFERSIKTLQEPRTNPRILVAMMNRLVKVGPDSIEKMRVRSALSTINITASEIDIIQSIFPELAEKRRKEIYLTTGFEVKNGDRLLADDLKKAIKSKLPFINFTDLAQANELVISIDRIRHDERQIPERSETITYAQHEVNLFSAALLMPRNASYIYEIKTSGIEINYGYAILARQNGKVVFDEIVRGSTSAETRSCQSARIQNVFGGTSSASFIANSDMQQRCNGARILSIEDLRVELFNKIAESILTIGPVNAAAKNFN